VIDVIPNNLDNNSPAVSKFACFEIVELKFIRKKVHKQMIHYEFIFRERAKEKEKEREREKERKDRNERNLSFSQ
jgi:hypothetical protein